MCRPFITRQFLMARYVTVPGYVTVQWAVSFIYLMFVKAMILLSELLQFLMECRFLYGRNGYGADSGEAECEHQM